MVQSFKDVPVSLKLPCTVCTDDVLSLAGGRWRCVTVISWDGRSPGPPGPRRPGCSLSPPDSAWPHLPPGTGQEHDSFLMEGTSQREVTSLTPFRELNTEKRVILRRNLSLVQGLGSFCVRSRAFFGHLLYYFSTVFSDFTLGGMAGISCHIGEVRKSVVSLGAPLGMEGWRLSAFSPLPLPPKPLPALPTLAWAAASSLLWVRNFS